MITKECVLNLTSLYNTYISNKTTKKKVHKGSACTEVPNLLPMQSPSHKKYLEANHVATTSHVISLFNPYLLLRYQHFHVEIFRLGFSKRQLSMGGARGGLGAITPRRSMVVPLQKAKNNFFRDFWHLEYPEKRILAVVGRVIPP